MDKYGYIVDIMGCKTVLFTDDINVWHNSRKEYQRVAKTTIGGSWVSTVFLGIDHNFDGPTPLWFETMVFNGDEDRIVERCETWLEAERMHERVCEMVRSNQS